MVTTPSLIPANARISEAGHIPPRAEVEYILRNLRVALLARGLDPGGREHGRRRNPKVKPRNFRQR